MDWGDFLNSQAQELIGGVVNVATPTKPVATTAGGMSYVEGKPAAQVMSANKLIFGLNPMIVYGGAAALLLGGYLLMRK